MFSELGEKGPAEGQEPGHGGRGPGHEGEELTMSISIRGTGGLFLPAEQSTGANGRVQGVAEPHGLQVGFERNVYPGSRAGERTLASE